MQPKINDMAWQSPGTSAQGSTLSIPGDGLEAPGIAKTGPIRSALGETLR
jgi:hypothetical protein